MCGRFTLNTTSKDLARQFELQEEPSWQPRYNIAPSQSALLILQDGQHRIATTGNWGFQAPWASNSGAAKLLINARGETVAEKPSFRLAFRHNRCLVPATSFFEWQKQGGQKLPWLFHLPDQPCFAMAGIWQKLDTSAGLALSFSVLTLPAQGEISKVHHRMPWILTAEQESPWLSDPSFHPMSQSESKGSELARYRVSPQVNRVSFDQASCLDPVPEEGSLF